MRLIGTLGTLQALGRKFDQNAREDINAKCDTSRPSHGHPQQPGLEFGGPFRHSVFKGPLNSHMQHHNGHGDSR